MLHYKGIAPRWKVIIFYVNKDTIMDDKVNETVQDKAFTRRSIDTAIKLGAITFVLMSCLQIIYPFILPIAWGAILAIALYPLFTKLSSTLGGRRSLAAGFIAIIGIALLVGPTFKFSLSAIESVKQVSTELKTGALVIPAPSEAVKEWPLVGDDIHSLWHDASENLQGFAEKHAEEIKSFSTKALGAVAGIGGVILHFILSLIIAAIFMVTAPSCFRGCNTVARRLMDEDGEKAIETSVATIRSVAVGILGIAITQALFSGIGMLFTDIPAAGVWVLAVLLLAIVQLPPLIILGPISAYYFSVADMTPAIIFLVWNLIISSSDAFLKPLFLGRGMETPMLVILLGAIGGMITSGIIGLFVGAVTLALGYELMQMWLAKAKDDVRSVSND